MKMFNIAVIAGDGIGKEVVLRVFGLAAAETGSDFDSTGTLLTGAARLCQDRQDDACRCIQQLRPFDAIFLEPSDIPVCQITFAVGLLIPIRRSFRQYVNLRL